LEGFGILSEEIQELDGNGTAWRQLYFMRQTFKTFMEAKSASLFLRSNKEFRTALKKAGRDFQAAINAFIKAAEAPELKNARNNIAAHVKHDAVLTVLKHLKAETSTITVGNTHVDTHYNFAKDLAWRLVLFGATEGEELEHMSKIGHKHLLTLLGAVDRVFTAYADWRHLV